MKSGPPNAMVNASLLRKPWRGETGRSRLYTLSHRRGYGADTGSLRRCAVLVAIPLNIRLGRTFAPPKSYAPGRRAPQS